MDITFQRVHELFDYDPNLGTLTWAAGGGKIRLGRKAGSMTNGRLQVNLPGGKTTLAYRLIWLWMTGQKPKGNLCAYDNNPLNLKWDNIAACNEDNEAFHHLFKRNGLWFFVLTVGDVELEHGPYANSQQAAQAFADMLHLFAGVKV